MPIKNPPDAQRCRYTDRIGRRCSHERLPDHETGLCYHHYNAQPRPGSRTPQVHPLIIASKLLPAGTSLDSPAAVKALLTGVLREVLEGNLSTRQASAVGYLGQTVLLSLQQMQRVKAETPAHPLLAAPPEATMDGLTRALQSFLEKGNPAEASAPALGHAEAE